MYGWSKMLCSHQALLVQRIGIPLGGGFYGMWFLPFSAFPTSLMLLFFLIHPCQRFSFYLSTLFSLSYQAYTIPGLQLRYFGWSVILSTHGTNLCETICFHSCSSLQYLQLFPRFVTHEGHSLPLHVVLPCRFLSRSSN